ncbi:hypothetical protein HY634_00795 [Candidatus Uhrbacteria bacterium]|nr:hypothetical protein [Candidatus Uhrbacteria bacterium]
MENLVDNRGLWGDKLSFRETLTDAEWEKFREMVLAKRYDEQCTTRILDAAITPHVSGPLPLGLILIATEFYMQKKGGERR